MACHCLNHHGHCGRGFIFSDTAIKTALMVKSIFKILLLWIIRPSQFDFYVDECPAKISYIHLHE
ncbi:Mobile element protein [Candidatus Enterovibrio escicola]|uniref:Mobile element protein n=1 Tax=Candidatus Enterovibrio escicola TaxID=1927127 RepID=A0A2A5T1B1_9GAMM|nr:Mobile element protein [Candidatus Enterovibrio escacola]